jgi:hypothetical protein
MRAAGLVLAGMLACLLAFGSAMAFVVPSRPGTVNALMDCFDERLFNAQSRDAPAAVAAAFAGQGSKLAFRTCRDTDRNIHYFLREPRPNPNGVCRTFEKEVFIGAPSDGAHVRLEYSGTVDNWYFVLRGWTETPPASWSAMRYPARSQVFGFVADGDCPPGDDTRYMALTNVTDGTLKAFLQAWSRVAASPESARAALGGFLVEAHPIPRFNTPERQRQFRERVIAAVSSRKESLAAMSCDTTGCAAQFDSFYAAFDIGPNGIVLTGLAPVLRA